MLHLPNLLIDLGLILVVAALTTLLFKLLKQPIVLGYIIAGFLVGPHFHLFPTVTDIESIKVWAEIGVVFLLFSLGIEFSFKKLIKVGGPASITAVIEVFLMLFIGYGIGRLFGWSNMDSIFLGGILSISSTTIIIRAFEELGLKTTKFAVLVFGVLIVEDLVAIILLVLLSTIAVSQQFAQEEMLFAIGKLVFYLILWFVLGIFFIPTLLKRTQKLMNDETLLIVSLGLCLAMVILVTQAGFSPALGAFIMGAILAETPMAERIEHITKPVKELFATVFFISVGMLIDPAMLGVYWFPIVIIILATIIGKMLSTLAGALLSGQPLQIAVQAGMSLAQIGEFSFIIATLGLTLNVTSDFLYPIAVAVSAITTFTTPYLIRSADSFYRIIYAILPNSWRKALLRTDSTIRPALTSSNWQIYLRGYVTNIVLFSAILTAILLLTTEIILPFISARLQDKFIWEIITALAALLIMTPFLWGILLKRHLPQDETYIWMLSKYRSRLLFLKLIRLAVGLFFITYLLEKIFPDNLWIIAVLTILTLLFLRWSPVCVFYSALEHRFLANLNEREKLDAIERGVELAPWDAHIAYFDIKPESPVVGKKLSELAIREKFGVNVARIKRGSNLITIPNSDTVLYPADRIFIIGTDAQIQKFSTSLEPDDAYINDQNNGSNISLQKITVSETSNVYKKTIRNSGIREKADGIVVGIERNGKRILNPDATMAFESGDIVWIVGDKKKIAQLDSPAD